MNAEKTSPGTHTHLIKIWQAIWDKRVDDDDDADDDDANGAGIYKNLTEGLMSDALCDEVDLSQFCQHVCSIILLVAAVIHGVSKMRQLWWCVYSRDVHKICSVLVQGKGNINLFSASSRTSQTHLDMDHTVLPANNTISTFTRKHSPDSATAHINIANAWSQHTTHLLTPRGWMAEFAMLTDIQRTVNLEEVTRQLHVMVQARESSPVIDWRSNHCATPPTKSSEHFKKLCPCVIYVSIHVIFLD